METNKLNTESALKFLGIIFLIGMVWFFIFTVFKTNNHYLGVLMKEQEENFDFKREGFGTMEGFKNLEAKGIDLKKKINKTKDDKNINQDKAGISKSASDDLKDDVSEYLRYEVENLNAKAVITLLNLDNKHKNDTSKFKAVEKLLKQREVTVKVEKIFNGVKVNF
tara:strand:- start:99 stop:596 length:498 start_codon:yes stop_codon:yes gene_type:complete